VRLSAVGAPRACVACPSCTVAFGRAAVAGAPGMSRGCVLRGEDFGAERAPGVLSCTVGAGAGAFGAPGADGDAVFKGMVGAGAGGLGAAGAPLSPAGTLSVVAFRVTRTVSFFKGTAEVFLVGLGGFGGSLESLIGIGSCDSRNLRPV
jgi:hypothetical protein